MTDDSVGLRPSPGAHLPNDYHGCPAWPCEVHPRRPRALMNSADFILSDGTKVGVLNGGDCLHIVFPPGQRAVAGSAAFNSLDVFAGDAR